MTPQIQFSEAAPTPFHEFRIVNGTGLIDTQKQSKTQLTAEEKAERVLVCRNCRNEITSQQYMFEVDGRYRHVFNNPEGMVFEIGCFSAAKGCVNHGSPTAEFTWFSGFSWRFSSCSNCLIHLGWQYQSKGRSPFWGLILNRLAEGR